MRLTGVAGSIRTVLLVAGTAIAFGAGAAVAHPGAPAGSSVATTSSSPTSTTRPPVHSTITPSSVRETTTTSGRATRTSRKEAPGTEPKRDKDTAKGAERQHNHGWCVSAVAQDKSVTGKAHGKAVSEVARSRCGKTSKSKDD